MSEPDIFNDAAKALQKMYKISPLPSHRVAGANWTFSLKKKRFRFASPFLLQKENVFYQRITPTGVWEKHFPLGEEKVKRSGTFSSSKKMSSVNDLLLMTSKWLLMTFKWPWDQKQWYHWIRLAKCFKNGPTFNSPTWINLLLFIHYDC